MVRLKAKESGISKLPALVLILTLFASSCVEVESIAPPFNSRYAVVALISPTDSIATVFVSMVNPLGQEFKASDLVVKDAVVSISSGNQQIQLSYVDSTGRYQALTRNFIRFDTRYDLSVETTDRTLLTASCKTLKETIPTMQLKRDGEKVEFSSSWNDAAGEANRYSLSISYWNQQLRRVSNSGIDWEGVYRSLLKISDQNIDGSKMTARASLNRSSSISDTTKFTLNFSNIDQATNDFFDKRSAQYNQNQANQQSVIDFIVNSAQKETNLNNFFERFKEPVLLPSNIQNGLGFFGSYYQKKAEVW